MKFLLILFVLSLNPSGTPEITMVKEPFFTLEDCKKSAKYVVENIDTTKYAVLATCVSPEDYKANEVT